MKILGLLNLIHSTTFKLEKSEKLNSYYLKGEKIDIPYTLSHSIGHKPNSDLELKFFNFLEKWIKSGFENNLVITSEETKELIKKQNITSSDVVKVLNMFDELVKYKDMLLLTVNEESKG